jgi:hypothetical protein
MHDGDILILKGQEVNSLLAGREKDLIHLVSQAYLTHEGARVRCLIRHFCVSRTIRPTESSPCLRIWVMG